MHPPSFPSSHLSRPILAQVYEIIHGPQAVQTAKEVAASLVADGFSLCYHRVPITDGTPPKPADFDRFYAIVADTHPDAPIIVNCQQGVARTTTGLVMATMLRKHLHHVRLPPGFSRSFSDKALHRLNSDPLGISPKMVSGQSDDDEDHSPRAHMASGMQNLLSLEPGAAVQPEGAAHGAGPVSEEGERGEEEEREDDGDAFATAAAATAAGEEEERMRDGDYVGVRRFTRILEYGQQVKHQTAFYNLFDPSVHVPIHVLCTFMCPFICLSMCQLVALSMCPFICLCMCPFICLSMCPCIRLSLYPFICLFTCPFMYLAVCPFICPSVNSTVYPRAHFICLLMFPFICLSMCPFIWLFMCPFICLSMC